MSYRVTRADEVRARVDAIRAAGVGLRALTKKDLEALCRAVRWVADDSDLRSAIARRTGLSTPMVEWGLRTSVESLDAERLLEVREQLGLDWESNASGHVAVVLSGNLFTACLKPMLWPLVLGVPVIAKATARDDVLVRALADRLPDPFANAIAVETFSRDETACLEALLQTDVVHVYGGASAIEAVRAQAPARALVVPHGHGFGVALVSSVGFEATQADMLALDVAAYDQHGCLSPREVWVVGDATQVAIDLAAALDRLEVRLPRGAVSDSGAQQSWLGTVQSLGDVRVGHSSVVAIEPQGSALPRGLGDRTVVVRGVASFEAAGLELAALGPHLKCVGYYWTKAHPTVVPVPPMPSAPRCVPIGQMQTPSFFDRHDGWEPWLGLVRR